MSTPACSPAELSRRQAIRVLISCTVFWGLSFPVMQALALAQQQLAPAASHWFLTAQGVMCRFGAAALILAAVRFPVAVSLRALEVEQGLVLAVFGAGGIFLQMDALTSTRASTCAFLTQGYCVFIPLWVAWRTRRRPPVKIVVSTLLVVLGAGVLSGVGWQGLQAGRGEYETVVASLLFAGQILTLEAPRYQACRPVAFSLVMFAGMSLCCAAPAMLTAPSAAALARVWASPLTVGLLVVLVGFCTLIAYVMMNCWQRRISATEAGLIYCIEPVIASGFALFLPGMLSHWGGLHYANERLTPHLLAGGGLITAANVLIQSRWLDPCPAPAGPAPPA